MHTIAPAIQICPICKGDFLTGRYCLGPGKEVCVACHSAQIAPKQRARGWRCARDLRTDILERKRAEMRAAIALRDSYSRAASAMRETTEQERSNMLKLMLAKMPLFRRIRLLLWPFAVLALTLTGCGPKAQDIDEFAQKVEVLTQAMTRAGLKVGAVGHIGSDKIGSIENALVGPWDIDVYVFGWSDPAAVSPVAGLVGPTTQPAIQP